MYNKTRTFSSVSLDVARSHHWGRWGHVPSNFWAAGIVPSKGPSVDASKVFVSNIVWTSPPCILSLECTHNFCVVRTCFLPSARVPSNSYQTLPSNVRALLRIVPERCCPLSNVDCISAFGLPPGSWPFLFSSTNLLSGWGPLVRCGALMSDA